MPSHAQVAHGTCVFTRYMQHGLSWACSCGGSPASHEHMGPERHEQQPEPRPGGSFLSRVSYLWTCWFLRDGLDQDLATFLLAGSSLVLRALVPPAAMKTSSSCWVTEPSLPLSCPVTAFNGISRFSLNPRTPMLSAPLCLCCPLETELCLDRIRPCPSGLGW